MASGLPLPSGRDSWAAGPVKGRRPYRSAKIQFLHRADIHTPSGSYVQGTFGGPSTTANGPPSPLRSTPFFDGAVNMGSRPPSPRKDKRRAQFEQWQDRVIPSLIKPFLQLMQESGNLRNILRESRACGCMPTVHKLSVLCLSFDSECLISFAVCRYSL